MQDEIIHQAHCTMIVQHCYVMKQNQRLHAKENKTTDHSILEGGARHLTADEVIEGLENHRKDKEQEAAEKERQREEHTEVSECKQMMESRWKEICAEHEQAIKNHKAECARLIALGTRKKDLPPKPKRHLKKDLMVEFNLVDAGHGHEEQDVTASVTLTQGDDF
jgi:hypothetical protein